MLYVTICTIVVSVCVKCFAVVLSTFVQFRSSCACDRLLLVRDNVSAVAGFVVARCRWFGVR